MRLHPQAALGLFFACALFPVVGFLLFAVSTITTSIAISLFVSSIIISFAGTSRGRAGAFSRARVANANHPRAHALHRPHPHRDPRRRRVLHGLRSVLGRPRVDRLPPCLHPPEGSHAPRRPEGTISYMTAPRRSPGDKADALSSADVRRRGAPHAPAVSQRRQDGDGEHLRLDLPMSLILFCWLGATSACRGMRITPTAAPSHPCEACEPPRHPMFSPSRSAV